MTTKETNVRDGYLEGVPCWIDSGRTDAGPMLRFYGGLFGWSFDERGPGYNVARLGGLDVTAIGSQETGTPDPPVWNTYVCVTSAEAACARVHGAGGAVVTAPFAVGDAGTMAELADPAGAHICVWEPGTHRGAQLVNAPGSWNWSSLATTDLEGALTFYEVVFGWEATTMEWEGVTSACGAGRGTARSSSGSTRARSLGTRRRRRRRASATPSPGRWRRPTTARAGA